MSLKTCTKCGIEKPLDEFGKHKEGKDGKNPRCKKCNVVCALKYKEDNLEKVKETQRIYRENNKEKVREAQKEWRRKDGGKWEKINREKVREANKKYKKTPAGKICIAKSMAKRKRELGYVPLNDWFPGCNGHHITKLYVIHIPEEMHIDNKHKMGDVDSMFKINGLAIDFLNEQRGLSLV